MADALCYASKFSPSHIIDLATLTGAIHVALGSAAAGVFTNSNSLWHNIYDVRMKQLAMYLLKFIGFFLSQNSVTSGDRVWRMPLYSHYSNKMKSDYADLNNIAKANSGGGPCNAAAFLKVKGFLEDDLASIAVIFFIAGVCGLS